MNYKRHYCYRIDFADDFVYFGVRTCRCSIASDSYTGSPVAHKAKWLTDIPRVKTIVSVHATRELANKAEARLIEDFWAASKPLSLNAAIHNEKFNVLGRKQAAEHLAKTSLRHKGKSVSQETRVKISNAGRGRTWASETRQKFVKSRTGENADRTQKKPSKRLAKQSEARSLLLSIVLALALGK